MKEEHDWATSHKPYSRADPHRIGHGERVSHGNQFDAGVARFESQNFPKLEAVFTREYPKNEFGAELIKTMPAQVVRDGGDG